MTRRPPDPLESLFAAIKEITGRPVGSESRRLFKQYLELFVRWNRVHRMTALSSPTAIVDDLFIDSLLLWKLLPAQRPIKLVDIGAGAGIPGLPLHLADPHVALTLVEAKRKRVSFLLTVRRELGLSTVAVVEGRAETVLLQQPNLSAAFDIGVARAVGPIRELLPTALPYLRPGGQLLITGPPGAVAGPGVDLEKVRIPGSRIFRSFLRVRKE